MTKDEEAEEIIRRLNGIFPDKDFEYFQKRLFEMLGIIENDQKV